MTRIRIISDIEVDMNKLHSNTIECIDKKITELESYGDDIVEKAILAPSTNPQEPDTYTIMFRCDLVIVTLSLEFNSNEITFKSITSSN